MLLVAFEGGLHGQKKRWIEQKQKKKRNTKNRVRRALGTRIEFLNYELECSKGHVLGLNIPI